MIKRHRSLRSVAVIVSAVGYAAVLWYQTNSEAKQPPTTTALAAVTTGAEEDAITVKISHEIPTDLPPLNGRENNTLEEAAVFAWQQFIAVTWPAKDQDGSLNSRDKPDTSRKYGEKGMSGQVVWETFRHKSEIFPGQGAPNGYDSSATEEARAAKDYGYDTTPKYIFAGGEIPPADGSTAVTPPPYNNLDEVDEIFLCDMHAGIAGQNELKGLVLYQAKANRVLYNYIAKDRPGDGGPLFQQTLSDVGKLRANSVFNLTQDDPANFRTPFLELPSSVPGENKIGTIEIKSAWRRLNTESGEDPHDDPARFYKAKVRFYVRTTEGLRFVDSKEDEIWGLIALHVIQKTESSPAFIYTTFGQVDNIRDKDGKLVEEPDGTLKEEYKNLEPFNPKLTITESKPAVGGDDATGQAVTAGEGNHNVSSPQLYYINESPFLHGVAKPIGINRRLFSIPPSIIAVNAAAQQEIEKYETENGVDVVWKHYKLVNVQAQTLESFVDRSKVAEFSDELKSSYYMANIVVETNVPLQQFSGGLSPGDVVPGFEKSGNADYALFDRPGEFRPDSTFGVFLPLVKNEPIFNTYVPQEPANGGGVWKKLNMGGCLGCHGGQGKTVGGDFSVIVARGRVPNPEAAIGEGVEPEVVRSFNLETGRNAAFIPESMKRRKDRQPK